jgi:hypothetical protein
MSAKLTTVAIPRYITLVRIFIIVFGCTAVAWGLVTFPGSARQSSIESISNRIIAGESFKIQTLTAQIPIVDSIGKLAYCRPVVLRSAAIIRLRMVEAAASAREHSDEHLKLLGHVIRSSLGCAPADPFLWLVLWQLENTQNGFTPDDLKYLRMSYRLGPNEGWIGLKRNRLTFAVADKLPVDLVDYAINEFVGLVQMGYYEQAAEIFTGPALRMREQILQRLQNIDERHRRAFADILYIKNYNGAVPGIERRGQRPWY